MPLYPKQIDLSKYNYQPKEDDVFMGPITLKELKKSVEVEDEVVRKRLAKRRAEAELAKSMQNKENEDESAKIGGCLRTPSKVFTSERVDSASKKPEKPIVSPQGLVKLSDTFITDMVSDMVLNATIPDEETGTAMERIGTPDIFVQEQNDSRHTSPRRPVRSKPPTSRSPLVESMSFFGRSPTSVRATASFPKKKTRLLPKSPAASKMPSIRNEDEDGPLDRTFELVEEGTKPQSVLNDITRLHYNLDETKLVDLSSAIEKSSIKPRKPVTAKCLLDETFNLNKSKIGGRLHTPLIDKVKERVDSESKENEEPVVGTPRLVKLSDTFITDMVGDMVLSATVSDEETGTAKRASTPELFKQKRNDSWKNSPRRSARSKLPTSRSRAVLESTRFFAPSPAPQSESKKKTPVKTRGTLFLRSPMPSKDGASCAIKEKKQLFASPVADYIHRGLEVKSMSKARHSSCVQPPRDVRPKSENKGLSQSKIPVSLGGNAKRKLNLVEIRHL